MKPAAVVITVLVAVLHARIVHSRMASRVPRKAGHTSEGKTKQAALISYKARLTRENLTGQLPESSNMDKLSGSDKSGDLSYVLVPLEDLMRSRRDSDEQSQGDQDPLYVMFPYQEIIRKTRDSDEDAVANVTTPNKQETPDSKNNQKVNELERRKRRGVSSQAKWLLKTRKISKLRPHALAVRRERMSLNDLDDIDYDETLHGESQIHHAKPVPKHFPGDLSDKKSRASIRLTDLRSQLHPEMPDGLHQKPRVLTDFSDLSPKIMQTVIGKPKKASVNPINITMFISNLIPPNEVENTRITNAGKLYKSGCLKFSIQLERPGPCSCSGDDSNCEDLSGKSCSSHTSAFPPVVTQRVALIHPGGAEDKGKPAEGPSSSPSSCGQLPATAKVHSGSAETNDLSKSHDPAALNRDVSSLLLQLISADKKLPKKTAATTGRTIVLDNEVIKEVQRLLANQVASKGSDSAGKSAGATQPPAAPLAPNSPKARAIAEALNLFSKYAALNQNNL